jgi:hypothetical protein
MAWQAVAQAVIPRTAHGHIPASTSADTLPVLVALAVCSILSCGNVRMLWRHIVLPGPIHQMAWQIMAAIAPRHSQFTLSARRL